MSTNSLTLSQGEREKGNPLNKKNPARASQQFYFFLNIFSYRRLHHLLGGHALPVQAGPVGRARRAVGPGQAAVFGGALRRAVLLAPQLAAGIAAV